MPGLVVFRRRWSIGSDDLILPAVGLAFLNIIWLLALAVLLLYIYTSCGPDEETCLQKFIWYPGTTMVLQLVLLAVHVAIAVQSGRGGVLDTEARKHLPCYCYIRAGLLVVELVWFCAGCGFLNWKLTSGHCRSTDFVYILMCVVVGANVVILFLTILATYLSFDSAGRTFWRLQELQNCTDDARRSALVRKLEARYRQKCMNRVNLAFCCESVSKPSDKKVFEDIALLMASYLDHLDLVLSDFLAGMKLLRLQQKALFTEAINQSTNDIYQYLSGTPISPRTKFLTLKDCKTKNELECMTYFAEYAVASYGWQGQYFFYPTKACCSINVCCRCEGCARWVNDLDFTGDNCCQCQYTAIAAGSPLVSEEDFIYGNYDNETNFPSYFVCLDHKYKKVLLCIRGTMSISDAAIDLQGDMKEIPVEPRQPSWLGHAGMVTSASNVYSDLAEKEVLKRAFNRCQGSDYQLLIIGHSLGAGVAPIIAFILQEQYPQLYCYAYSPPGGLLSLDAVEESKKFTTSIVIGKDIIPRLGTAQLEYFRSDLLALLEDCKEPKWKIIFSGWPLIGRCLNVKESMTLPRARSQDYNPFQPNTHSSVHTHLYPPGRIIHIVKNYPKDSGKDQKPMYQAIWSDNKSFDTIIVSPKMVEDHMPNTVLDAMKNVLAHHGPKKPSKVLTEEERQAILQEDEGADHHSHTSDFSWEDACPSEADTALQKLVIKDEAEPPVAVPNGGIAAPKQWHPAPLASLEDLLSIRRSRSSVSSNKGSRSIDCRLHSLSESPERFILPRRVKSTSHLLRNSLSPLACTAKGSNSTELPHSQFSTCDTNASSCSHETLQEAHLNKASNFNCLDIPIEQDYFAHIGHGNQVEYNNTDPGNASACFYNAQPAKSSD